MDIAIDISNTRLETERLLLRPWREEDVKDCYEYAAVPGVGEMAGWKHHESMEETREILRSFIAEKNVFAVADKENGKVIGSLGLHESWANKEREFQDLKQKEIGYVLSKAYWGNGLIPEAVKRVISFCFDECGLDALTVGHFTENSQSRRVIEKCGFYFVKKGEYHSKQLNQSFEEKLYILLRSAKKRMPE